MAERHGNARSLRTANASATYSTSGNSADTRNGAVTWRPVRNGLPEGDGYQYNGAREQEVGVLVAAARAEAMRRCGLTEAELEALLSP